MFKRKVYGQSAVTACLFCGKQATTKNEQKVPVCIKHKTAWLNDFKCICGDYLDIRESKHGMFFTCMKCGAVSLTKALEINQVWDEHNLPHIDEL